MGSFSQNIVVGFLGANPEIRYTPSGQAVANFQVATHEVWTKDGEKQERTEWHRVVAWRRLAEIVAEYTHKGSLVLVVGQDRTRQWEDRDGNKRWTTEIIANRIQLLDRNGSERPPVPTDEDAPDYQGPTDMPDDDVPF